MNHSNPQEFDVEIIESPEDQIEIVEDCMVVEDEPSESIDVSEEENLEPVEYEEWETPEDFEKHIMASARNLPPVYENSKNSLKRAYTYLEKLSEEITDGVQKDAPYSELNENQLRMLDSIEEGTEVAMRDISAAMNGQLRKTATKSTKFQYFITPFIFGLARILINGMNSQGKNIEKLFEELDKQYKLTERERVELYFALNDMGYPIRSSAVEGLDRMETYQA